MLNEKKKSDRTVLTVILCFIIVFCGLGIIQPRGLYVVPVTTALGISRSAYSVMDTIRAATSAIISVFFGFFIEKFGSKILIIAGFAAYALAELAFALAENVILLYVGGFFLGIGIAWTGTAVVGFVINSVCTKHRGPVLGAVLAANGIGGAVFAQIYAPFLSTDDLFGYRKAYYLTAIILAAVMVLLLIFYKNPASARGNAPKKKQRAFTWEGIEFSKAKKTVYFYLVCACVFITGLSLQGLSSARSAYMQDVGFEMAFVATVSSVSAIALACSKFLSGIIFEKTGLRATVSIGVSCALAGIVILLFLTDSATGKALSIIYALMVSVAMPLETVMLSIYASELFGDKSFGKVIGIFAAMHYTGSALASPTVNVIYDLSGSYKPAFMMLGVAMILMLVMIHIAVSRANAMRLKIQTAEITDTNTEGDIEEDADNA